MYYDNLKTGDLLFCTRKTLLSRLIRLFTKSKFSHVAVFIELHGTPYTIDAQKRGVNLATIQGWESKYKYDVTVLRSPIHFEENTFCARALSKTGLTRYDVAGLFIWHPLQVVTGRWIYKGAKKEEEKMTCSEFAAWCYNLADYYKMTPEELYEISLDLFFYEIPVNN